jgi:hypothetical protein
LGAAQAAERLAGTFDDVDCNNVAIDAGGSTHELPLMRAERPDESIH